jgi:hypothetical protein
LVNAAFAENQLRYLLITLIIACWGGAAASVIVTQEHQPHLPLAFFPLMAVINGLCAIYLYRQATTKKAEWALFGFLGNVSALLVFWLVQNVSGKWSKGQRYFR